MCTVADFHPRRRVKECLVELKHHIYYWMAEECERRALEASAAEIRTAYLELAESWRSLAVEATPPNPGRPHRPDGELRARMTLH